MLVNGPAVVALQKVWFAGTVTIGVGFTVMVKLWVGPTHPFAVGVTVTIDVAATVPLLSAIKEDIPPEPTDASPVLELLLAHVYVVPATGPVKLNAPVDVPLQKLWLAGTTTVGVGYTVTVNVCAVPTHPIADVGVTVNMPEMIVVPLLVPVNERVLPLPDAPVPMLGLLFTHA